MKREDFEKNLDLLSFDEIEEDDFMLNTPTKENKDIFDLALDFIEEDNVVDTKEEQDLLTEVELDEIIELPQIDIELLDELNEQPEVMVIPLTTPRGTRFHIGLDDVLEYIEKINPKRAIINHMAVECDYKEIYSNCPSNTEPAYDGLSITW